MEKYYSLYIQNRITLQIGVVDMKKSEEEIIYHMELIQNLLNGGIPDEKKGVVLELKNHLWEKIGFRMKRGSLGVNGFRIFTVPRNQNYHLFSEPIFGG